MKYDAKHLSHLTKKYNRPKRLLPNGTETYQQEDIRRVVRIFQDIMQEGSECGLVRGGYDSDAEFLTKAQLDFESILLNLTGHTLSQVTLALAEGLRQREALHIPFDETARDRVEGLEALMSLDVPV